MNQQSKKKKAWQSGNLKLQFVDYGRHRVDLGMNGMNEEGKEEEKKGENRRRRPQWQCQQTGQD